MYRHERDRRPGPARACRVTGKVSFESEIDAEIVLAKRRRQDKGEQRAYECDYCPYWHLTSWESVTNPGDPWGLLA